MFGNNLADIFEGAALCGAYYVHHLFVTGPLLGFAEHFFEEAFAVGVFRQLEVVRAFVAGQRKQDYPFAFVRKERGHTVFAHVRSYGYGIYIQLFEEGTGIHGRGVPDVTAFGVGDDELVGIVLLDVVYGFLESYPAFHAHALIKCQIGLVGDAEVGSSVDDGFVESEYRVFFFQKMFGYFLDVGVKTYAKE